MALKKSELYSSIWASCDELRGGMDASQYKDYVLVLLFVKYVSDKYAGQKNPLIEVPEGGSFTDMVALKGKVDIGDKMNKIIARLAEANELKGVIDVADFNDSDKLGKGKEMQDRLSNLVAIFENPSLDFSKNRAEGDDLLGDAYEYLMRNFATESGKSKGQFYTPAEVSRVIAKVIGIRSARSADTTIYDPTCGSGSLLLKAADEAVAGSGVKISIYGQEMDNATHALARMNMILHNNPEAEIYQGNTLADPQTKAANGTLKTFDYVVANPPFSTKAWSSGLDPAHDPYDRFADGTPPAKNGDYAFLLHILRSMKSTGRGAVILPHGVLFRGNSEGDIRKNLVRKGYFKGIIGLPANLFFGTGIPACIIVLDKENAAVRTGIFMINASQGFMKDGNKNRLRHQDIHKIVDVFTRQLELPRYSRLVPLAEIESNDYNLNIPRYIDNSEEEDVHDITAHLCGGIPNRDLDALSAYWQVFPSLSAELFQQDTRPGYSLPRVEAVQVKSAIFGHPEFTAFNATIMDLFNQWQTQNKPLLLGLKQDSSPKALIEKLSESFLTTFAMASLLDKYDLYQRLMTYWAEVMQDDVYLIVGDGWLGASKPRQMAEDRKTKEKPDLEIGKLKLKADLIPPTLIVARYFAAEKRAQDDLKAEQERISQQLDEIKEDHGGEEGLLAEVQDEKGNISKETLMVRLKVNRWIPDADSAEERRLLEAYLALIEKEAEVGRKVKETQKTLDEKVINQYRQLTEGEVKKMVVVDKWLKTLNIEVASELNRVSQTLTGRIKDLAERYSSPLPLIMKNVETLSNKVDANLLKMGLVWK
jgi:type I restriction enzyme M protein